MPRPGPTNEAIAEALKKTKGMVYVAADLIDCDPMTIKRRLRDFAWLRDVKANAEELSKDVGELKLLEAINAREPWAVQFFLRTKAKDRGYGDEKTIKGDPEHPVVIRTITAIIPSEVADDGDAS